MVTSRDAPASCSALLLLPAFRRLRRRCAHACAWPPCVAGHADCNPSPGSRWAAVQRVLYPNGERHLRSRAELARIYPADCWQYAGDRPPLHFSLDELQYQYPQELVPAGHTPASCLRSRVQAGLRERWPGGAPDRSCGWWSMSSELIDELRYEAYFLTVDDIVRFARSRGILCQGRGSAANSAVCFCLGITAVDPARMSTALRALHLPRAQRATRHRCGFRARAARRSHPVHLCRYGRDRAALTATVITYCRAVLSAMWAVRWVFRGAGRTGRP